MCACVNLMGYYSLIKCVSIEKLVDAFFYYDLTLLNNGISDHWVYKPWRIFYKISTVSKPDVSMLLVYGDFNSEESIS